MVKVALITEGVTDQFIIKPVIENFYKHAEFKFNPIQPSVDETDKQLNFGGWHHVITLCKDENIVDLFKYNDIVVIQIDADVSQEKGFDVPHLKQGKEIEGYELCENIIAKLQSLIPKRIWEKHSKQFLFAIGIYSMECWLIPIHEHNQNRKYKKNCIERLNRNLKKKNLSTINTGDKNNYQSRSMYKKLASNFRDRKNIIKYAAANEGFEKFIDQLDQLKIVENN